MEGYCNTCGINSFQVSVGTTCDNCKAITDAYMGCVKGAKKIQIETDRHTIKAYQMGQGNKLIRIDVQRKGD